MHKAGSCSSSSRGKKEAKSKSINFLLSIETVITPIESIRQSIN